MDKIQFSHLFVKRRFSMARLKMKKKEMSRRYLSIFLLFQILCKICHSLETVESHSQAFIQTDNHLTYIVGDVSSGIPLEVKPGQAKNDIIGSEDILLSNVIHLDPPMLDFLEQPVGMPRMEQVKVQNTDGKNNLHLLSISGSTAHFHCSFFQDKIVPPGGNTTFDVVFLARQEGNVENTLYIHTSLGSFKYQVFGVGVPNPYRLRPYIGARVPLNSSFAPLVNMHNPHSSTLQVLEMFTSEGDLHLELPTGDKEAPRSLWEIPPYETKTIIKANFIGRTENNHTAFIRIKTNHKEEKEMLVLPMEVEVSSAPGVYVTQELLDFGIIRTFDAPKTIPLNLINTGDTPVHISSVTVSPPNDAVSVDFRPIKIQPELLRQTTVAQLTFRASKAIHPKLWSGKIIIRTKNNLHKITIPYEAKVLHGSLTYHKNMTYFFAHNYPTNYSRFFTFTNTFNFSLVLYNVTLPPGVKEIFTIFNFTKPMILPPQKMMTPFLLKFHPKIAMMHFRTLLTLHTNASIFEIELIVYNGQFKLIPHRPEKSEGQLDFGTMGVKENKTIWFTLVNDNPVDLYIYEYSTDMKGATIQVIGIERGNGTTLTRIHNMSAITTSPLRIWPYHFAVFSLNLVAPEEEGAYQAEVILSTPFQEVFMPVSVRTSEGSLHAIPEEILFEGVFPGKIPMKVLQVHSTFHEQTRLKTVMFQPPDPRFIFINTLEEKSDNGNNKLLVLEPQTNNTIGKIYFDAKKVCRDECYIGLPTYTDTGHQWLLGLTLEKDVSETDRYLYTHFKQRWQKLKQDRKDRLNVTVEIDTSTVQGFLFSAHVRMIWPRFIRHSCGKIVDFPLTQIGNLSTIDIIVENLGDTPVIAQILPLHLYPNPHNILDLFKEDLPPHFTDHVETEDKDIFVLNDLELLNPIPDSSINIFRKLVDDRTGVKSHRDAITILMLGGVRLKIQLGFRPKDDIERSTLILVRNNLTIIDAIPLRGSGGRGEMKLNNKKPGTSILQFDIAEKHLKNCDKKKHSKNMVPNFTVKRSFTLKNTGKLPFYVHGYSINNSPCEGYGFRVLDCEGFEMLPNTSRKIDIAFTPDFTMSRIQRVLTVFTSLGPPFNYTLQATVPAHFLSKCSSSLPRPDWEPALYYTIICMMGFVLFFILVASYFEADRIFVADILRRKVKLCNGNITYNKDKIFDLKSIGVTQNNSNNANTTLKPVPNVIRLNPPIIRPVAAEIPNSHIEQKSREPFMNTLFSLIKGLMYKKSNNGQKKNENNNTEPNSLKTQSRTLDGNDSHLSAHKVNTAEKDKTSPREEMIAPEKSNPSYSQQKITQRKTKAARRSYTDINATPNTNTSSNNGSYDRKTGNSKTNTANQDKRSSDQNNTVKEKQITPTMSDSSGLALFDVSDTNRKTGNSKTANQDKRSSDQNNTVKEKQITPTMSDSSGLALFDVSDSKQKGKKKLRSKPEHDSSVKDRTNLKPADDKDETSSTTTESSTGDVEEKSSSAREGTPEPPPTQKPKKTRNKSRHLEPLVMPHDDDTNNEFELTSKSRAYKRVKSQKDLYGEDVSKPSAIDPNNLELPYSMDNKPKTKKKKVVTPTNKDLEPITTKSKLKGPPAVVERIEGMIVESHQSESDSPPPSWDDPDPTASTGDLSELHIQTDQFAQKQAKTLEMGIAPNFSPEGLNSSSRSSSYSSIVSSSSGEGANGKNKADKRYPVGFTPFSETIPVPITPRTPPVGFAVPGSVGSMRKAWGNNGSAPTTPDPIGFGLQTIQESSRPGNTLTDTQADMFNQQTFGFGSGVRGAQGHEAGYGFPSGLEQNKSMSMMQQLQMDRRRRVQEHNMRVMKGEDWPGFDVPIASSQSLWDTEYSPLESGQNAWAVNSDTSVSASNGIWSTLTNSANSGWNSLMGIWNSQPPSTSGPLSGDTAFGNEGAVPINVTAGQNADTLPAFSPFSSDIWSPSAAPMTSGWQVPAPGPLPGQPSPTKPDETEN